MEKKQWKQSKGLTIIYVGDGKGKTTAAMGAAVRALGHGWNVYVAQFIKEEKWPSGERDFFRALQGAGEQGKSLSSSLPPGADTQLAGGTLRPQMSRRVPSGGGPDAPLQETSPTSRPQGTGTIRVEVVGEGFVGIMGDRKSKETHRAAAQRGYEKARSVVKSGEYALVILDEILSAVDEGLLSEQQILDLLAKKPEDVTLIMTGHKHYPNIFAKADVVTEMKKLKHPFDEGFIAKQGIDY